MPFSRALPGASFAKAGLLSVVLLAACSNDSSTELQSVRVSADSVHAERELGLILSGNDPYSGVVEHRDAAGTLTRELSYLDGRRSGRTRYFYPTGRVSYEAFHLSGKLVDTARSWWRDGTLRSESTFRDGLADGYRKEWYRSGNPFKHYTYVAGLEQGMQRSWRENGSIYNNYEARDGRIYGLKRAELCFTVKDEYALQE